ncbi:hypothetical protein M0M57_10835 [Flavobacterium azooxidireducens]|uniref:Uncharacterized protein n=1 Tax=Flavobacterium azooxidireducens TaxID=1871076 RepID=A0ABY4KE98_9FLAO|nr:hypothetical protein [Flavobacterium azooxidireducens]UPQ78118.1 hypothetical protein M0M57_10835 [Flavobacterium azooxidireducens]
MYVSVGVSSTKKIAEGLEQLLKNPKATVEDWMDYFKKRKKVDDATDDVLRKLSEIEELKRIDDAIEKLNITISVPKNTLNALESLKRIESILLKLKNKKPPKIFDPNKEALKKLGIKLPKSKNGVSVDFENTSYLYPSTGNQKIL